MTAVEPALVPRAAPLEDGAEHVGGVVLLRLAQSDIWRLVRNPWYLTASALAAGLVLWPWRDGHPDSTWPNAAYLDLGSPGAPMSLVAVVAAASLVLRDSRRTTADLLASSPTTRSDRLLAFAMVGVVPVFAMVATMVGLRLLVGEAGGVLLGGVAVVPSWGYLAGPVVTVATSWTLGLLMAVTLRSWLAVIPIAMLVVMAGGVGWWMWGWFPAHFLMPYASPLIGVDIEVTEPYPPAGRVGLPFYDDHGWAQLVVQEDRVLWHHVYLVGAGLCLLALACWRSGPDRRTRWSATAGLVLVVAGLSGQLMTWGGALRWGFLPAM